MVTGQNEYIPDDFWRKLQAIFFSLLMVTSVMSMGGVGMVGAAETSQEEDSSTNASEAVMCGVIDEPGEYHLSEDLTGLSSTCITITSSDVTFDGNGHQIAGDSPDSNTYGIFADGTGGEIANVVVRNVDVTGWDSSGGQGIRFENVNGGEISNVNANDNNAAGIELLDTDFVTVSDVSASGNSRGLGINSGELGYESTGNVIENSQFNGNTNGIRVQGIEDTVIRDSELNNNNRGFWKDNGVSTTIERTSANDNNNEGFRISSGDVTITDGEANNNDGEAGVWLETTSNAVIQGVTANDNNQAGIWAQGSSGTGQHTLIDNTVRNNGFAGVWLENSAGTTVSGTTATDNRFGVNVRGTNDNTISGTYATDNDVGVLFESAPITSTGITTLSDSVVYGNLEWDFEADNSNEYAVENLDLGASTAANTTVSFEGDDVRIRGVSTPPAHSETGIDRYFEAEGNELDIDVHYLQGDVETVTEDWLTLWKHDGSEWTQVDGSTVDTVERTVSASITDFSTFGVFETQPPVIFEVSIEETNAPVTAGEELRVTTTVTNTGSEAGTQTVELLNGTTVLDSNVSVELSPGESTTFDLLWQTTESDAGEHDLTVRSESDSATITVAIEAVPSDPSFDVDITGTNEPVTAGDSLVVTATVTNVGSEETTGTVELIGDDGVTTLDNIDVTLDAGADEAVDLTWETTAEDTGVFDLSVVSPSDSDTVLVTVDAPTSDPFFAVSIDDTNEPISAGDTLEVSATIANTGDEEGTQTVELVEFDGTTVVDSTPLTLAAGATDSITLQWADAPEGTGDVTVRTEDDTATRAVAIGVDAAVEVDSCRVIDTAGTYELSGDLSGDDTCITIIASNVTLDGNGHAIVASNATGSDWGIHVTGLDGRVENVTVTNVVLEGWDKGVRFQNVDDSDLSNVVVENGSTGIVLSSSHGNELTDLTIRDNDRRGLSLSSSNNNLVSGVEASGNEASTTFSGRGSVYLFSSSNNEFTDISVTDGRSGVRISFSSGNEFVGLTTERHATYGLEVGSNSNTFTDIVVNDNGWHGIQIQTASFNSFENVSVSSTDGSAVRLTGSSGSGSAPQNNVFENVSVTDNDGAAISLSMANYNTFRDVTTASNTGTAVTFVSRAEGNLVEFGEINHGSNTAVNFGSDSIRNTVREVSLSGTGTPFIAQDGAPNNEFDRVDVDGTVVSLSARGVGSYQTSPTTLPADATPIGSYLGLTPHSAGTTHVEYLRFHYEMSDVDSVDESELAVWRLSDGWESPTDAAYVTGVDTDQQYVFANGIDGSALSATFGAFAAGVSTELDDDGTDDDGSSGDGGTDGSSSSGGPAPPVEPEPEPEAPFFAVSIVETTSPVTAGQTLEVTAVAENTGEETGTGTIELLADGTIVDSTALNLSSGDEAAVTLSWATTADDVGDTIPIEVRSDDDATTAVVTVEPVDEDAEIVLYGARAQSDAVSVGETVTVIGDFYNLGTTTGERTVTLFVDGEAVDDATVTVSPGLARGAAQLTWTPSEDNLSDGAAETEFTLSLDGLLVGTVTVENPYSDIRVIAASASESELVEGDQLYVIGSIYQGGNIEGTEEIELTATNTETSETEVVGSQEVTLQSGFYHLGAINITYTPAEAGTYDLQLGDRNAGTVEVEPAVSDIQVIAASPSEIELLENEQAYVIGSIYQGGNIEGTEEIELTATNTETSETEVVGSQEVTLRPGFYHLGAVNITFEPTHTGTYDLELGDRNAGTIVVEAAESDIQVIAASVSAIELVEGEQTYVIGSIYQGGNIEGTEELELTATNTETDETSVVGSQEVTLAPGYYHLGALNVTFAPDEPGTYDLELDERPAGTVEVQPAESDIQVIAASVADVEILQTEETYVIGSIYQAGNIDGPQEIALNATNQETGETHTVDTVEIELAPGYYHLGALNVTFAPEEAGTYDLELGDRNAGFVEVEPAEPDIQVIAASASKVEVIEGESFSVVGSIYNGGDVEGTETIELTATSNETGETLVLGSQEVTLDAGFYHLGAINITAELEEFGYYDLKLGTRDAGLIAVEEAITDITVIAASTESLELVEGEKTYVIGSVYQGGNVEATEEISLTATHQETNETQVVGSQDITLAPGYYHLGALNITFEPTQAGTYNLELGDRNAGTVAVAAAESDIQVIAAGLSEIELVEGEQTYVIGSIYQAGNIEGTEEIELTATNTETSETSVVGSQEVTLAPGYYHLGALNVTFAPEDAGTYDLELGERPAGTVEVQPAESDIRVIAASPSEIELLEDEHAYVIGSIYQAGNIDGPQEIALNATNQETGETQTLATVEAELAPGFYHLGALNVTFVLEQAGMYDLELGERPAGTVEIQPAVSDIQVIAASASAVEMVAGQEAHVIGSIYQGGTIDGPQEIALNATNQDTGETQTLATVEAELRPGFYHLGALNVTFTLDEPGTYELQLGDRTAGTIEVVMGTVDVDVVSVKGQGTGFDVETGEPLVYTSTSATVDVDVESDAPLEEVTLLVSSQATTFAVTAAGTHVSGDRFTIDVPLEDIPDDGRYDLTVVAADVAGTGDIVVAEEVLVVDRTGPSLSVSIENVDSNDATIVVESTEPLAELSSVTAERTTQGGSTSTETVSMTRATDTRFTGTLIFEESGQYNVTAVGTDRAGNDGTDTASVTINTGFTLNDGEIIIDNSGTSILFDIVDDADEAIKAQELFIALSENSVSPNVGGGDLGVGFITAELDGFLDYHLEQGTIESATISMAVDESSLPSGTSASDAQMHYYDQSAGQWDPVETDYEIVDGDQYLVSTVTHFSTYGALIVDERPPTIDSVDISPRSPVDGDDVTVTFEYSPVLSAIDVSATELVVSGVNSERVDIQITTSRTTVDISGLTEGEHVDIELRLVDKAGNEATETASTGISAADTGSDTSPPTDEPSDNEDVPDETEGQEEASTDDSGPGMGLMLGVISLLLFVVVTKVWRRQSQR